MTRKDYVAIAKCFHDAVVMTDWARVFPVSGETMHSELAGRLADVMARDNPRFDRARFLKAAGVQS